jgi:hypothetical protein
MDPMTIAMLAQAAASLMGAAKGGPPPPSPGMAETPNMPPWTPTQGAQWTKMGSTAQAQPSPLTQGSVQNPLPVNTPSPLESTGPPGGFKPVTPVEPPTPDDEMLGPDFNTTLGYAQMAAGAGGTLGSLYANRNRGPGSGGMAGRPFQMQPSMRLGDLMQRRRYY